MPRRSEKALWPLRQVLLTWRIVEEWFQDELQGSPWTCINPECSVGTLGLDREPVEALEGHFRCPECSEFLSYRCGAIYLPVGEVVPPDVCKSSCRYFSCCIRFRLHEICQREVANWSSLAYLDFELDPGAGHFFDDEAWGTTDDAGIPGAMPSADG
jgi:hypothetical protein